MILHLTELSIARDKEIKRLWDDVVLNLSNQFADGETLDLEGIIYIIGLQEKGNLKAKYSKDDKINLMHIAICRLLEPFGYYEFDYFDADGWPHYKTQEKLPPLKPGEQTVLMKEAIVNYFLDKKVVK